jgi:membrane fusion protein, multidrug efflux system
MTSTKHTFLQTLPIRPVLALAIALGTMGGAAVAGDLASAPARAAAGPATAAYDGVVEALRQTTIAAQVSGAVVALEVKAGDRVRAGQVLMRLDARAAEQNAAAGAAEFKAAQAQAAAQLAQAGAASTQSGFYVVRAPYAGVVADVPVTLGDMALPGRALVTLYDPIALRVTAAVPQTAALAIGDGRAVTVEVPAMAAAAQRMQTPQRVDVLPAADAATHTVTLRADLAPGLSGLVPGQFARVWLPAAGAAASSPWVPLAAIQRRAEMTGLYVLDANGRPLLRQVRLGRSDGVQVEVLSGLAAGEKVASDAQAAARLTASAK